MPKSEPVSLYYRAPEGEDVVGKLAYTSKYTGAIGVALGVIDATLLTKTKSYLGALGRIGYFVVPLVGMSTAFVCTTYITTNLRKKDDKWNYAMGGAVAGSIFGAWRRSAGLGTLAASVLAFSASFKKTAVDNGWIFFPAPIAVAHTSIGSRNCDFTLTKEIPGNWTTTTRNS